MRAVQRDPRLAPLVAHGARVTCRGPVPELEWARIRNHRTCAHCARNGSSSTVAREACCARASRAHAVGTANMQTSEKCAESNPSASPEPTRSRRCRVAEVADAESCGATLCFHLGDARFLGPPADVRDAPLRDVRLRVRRPTNRCPIKARAPARLRVGGRSIALAKKHRAREEASCSRIRRRRAWRELRSRTTPSLGHARRSVRWKSVFDTLANHGFAGLDPEKGCPIKMRDPALVEFTQQQRERTPRPAVAREANPAGGIDRQAQPARGCNPGGP